MFVLILPPPTEPPAFVLTLPAYRMGVIPVGLPPAPDWGPKRLKQPKLRLPANPGARFTYRGPECLVSPGADTLILIGLSFLAGSTGGHVDLTPPEARNGLVRPPR